MQQQRTLVIYPNDPTTRMLQILHENIPDVTVMDESFSNSQIRHALMSDEFYRVILLGHGDEYGLCSFSYSKTGMRSHLERMIINSEHVQFLRNHEVIGIFCNANMFAERYNLTGLFSGMVISELSEAMMWNISETEENIAAHMDQWSQNLSMHITENWNNLREVPSLMDNHLNGLSTALERFNYPSIFYFENGECLEEEREFKL